MGELIEDEYRTIALSPALRDTIEELVLDDFDRLHASSETEHDQLEQQRIQLVAQRQKLLDAHYAGAIPIDLLEAEQDRIASRLAGIEHELDATSSSFNHARELLADTLDLTRDCHALPTSKPTTAPDACSTKLSPRSTSTKTMTPTSPASGSTTTSRSTRCSPGWYPPTSTRNSNKHKSPTGKPQQAA
ncbi:hypothetical protein [Jatrophihabitans sp. GAS493]|uniref:hypothetical protein n=1 Tax=Jatrophihabitans sp. GAS493 TaxID=1907575 RepID=UPI0012FE5D8C|nr:hypothetical protein [Jatrophihabitans sp. GAS493]